MSEEDLILVVDDNRQNLIMLESFLQEEGYATVAAPNGEEALQILENEDKIKLILLDVIMPGINGIEVCKKVKFAMGRDELPIILVTSLDAREDRLEGLEAGADDFITKPIDWAELMARVKSLLRLKKAHDRVQKQHQRLEHQLELARRVQRTLADLELPQELPGEIFYSPMEKIGGDVYDVVQLAEGKFGLLLADAMGHGVPAAMIMVMVKLIFRSLNYDELSPDEVMGKINIRLAEIFQKDIEDMFVTGIYMEYNKIREELKFCNAGHPSPLLFNFEGNVKELTSNNIPLGITSDNNFKCEKVDITNFSEVFIYTDGLVEHMSSDLPELTEENINYILQKTDKNIEKADTTDFYKNLKEEIALKGRDDDITYMFLKIG